MANPWTQNGSGAGDGDSQMIDALNEISAQRSQQVHQQQQQIPSSNQDLHALAAQLLPHLTNALSNTLAQQVSATVQTQINGVGEQLARQQEQHIGQLFSNFSNEQQQRASAGPVNGFGSAGFSSAGVTGTPPLSTGVLPLLPPNGVSSLPTNKELTGNAPPQFDGEEADESKRHQQWVEFEGKMKDYWFFNPVFFGSEYTRVTTLHNYLKRKAYIDRAEEVEAWKTAVQIEDSQAREDALRSLKWRDSKGFLSSLANDFKAADVELIARTGAIDLVFGKTKAGDFSRWPEFIHEFSSKCAAAKMPPSERVFYLRQKVKDKDLWIRCKTWPDRPADDDFNKWVAFLDRAWRQLENDRVMEGQFRPPHSQPRPQQQHSQQPAADYPDRMDLSRLTSKIASPQEVAYRRENRLCMRCGGADHFARDCTDDLAATSPRLQKGLYQPKRLSGKGGYQGGRGNQPSQSGQQQQRPQQQQQPWQQGWRQQDSLRQMQAPPAPAAPFYGFPPAFPPAYMWPVPPPPAPASVPPSNHMPGRVLGEVSDDASVSGYSYPQSGNGEPQP